MSQQQQSATKTVYNALPKLPQYNFSELEGKSTYGRRQMCVVNEDGSRTVRDLGDGAGAGGVGGGSAAASLSQGCGIPVRVILQHFPEWKTLDDKVLRFFGYYVEVVDNSTVEQSRVRKVKVHFYLGDGTLSVTETPAVANSGLREGTTVARSRVDGVDVFALSVGGFLTCRGLTYELVDCDAATRDFYETMGMSQSEPLAYPDDAFERTRMQTKAPPDEHQIAIRRAAEMEAAKASGTHTSLMTPEERVKARNFFDKDRSVLRFYAVWQQREFRIYYYLADDTISIMFDYTENDGRDHYKVFAKRNRVPQSWRKGLLLQTDTLNRPPGSQVAYVTCDDLRTGETIDLNGRDFYIYDCDANTRDFFAARGVSMAACARPVVERDLIAVGKVRPSAKNQPQTAVQPGKTYGASTMVFADTTRAEKDAVKLIRYTQDVFRFGGRMVNPSAENAGRVFLISYFLADDTVAVYELPVENSGHAGGKIFARREVPEVSSPEQLKVGATLTLEGVTYLLEQMDERTKRYLAMGMPHMDDAYFRTSDLISGVQQKVLQRFSRVTDAFRHYASSSTQGLQRENVREIFTDCGTRVTEAELDAVMARVDGDHDGWVSLPEFTESFLGQQFMSDFKPKNTAVLSASQQSRGAGGAAMGGSVGGGGGGLGTTALVQRGPVQSAKMLADKAQATKDGDDALRTFITLMEARRTLVIRAIRGAAADTYDGNLGMQECSDCLEQRLKLSMSTDELGALLYKFYYTPGMPNWAARRLPTSEIERLVRL